MKIIKKEILILPNKLYELGYTRGVEFSVMEKSRKSKESTGLGCSVQRQILAFQLFGKQNRRATDSTTHLHLNLEIKNTD